MSQKSRKCGPKAFEKLTWKTHSKNNEKRVQNTSKNEFKKNIPWRFFEVWRQRCSQGGPKGSPRHLPGSNLWEKGAKMEAKCHEKAVFCEFQLKAKCYRMLFLRLARLGGKTYGGCLPDASQFPPSPGGVEDGPDSGAHPKKRFCFFGPEKMIPESRPQGAKMESQNR